MIQLRDICRNFLLGSQTVHALKGINLEIADGEYVSVMGPSGSGKSTLLNLIALLDRPNQGDYLFNGQDVTNLSDDELAVIRRHNIGFVFQFFHLIARLSAAENVEIPMVLSGMSPTVRKQKVWDALKVFDLNRRADHRPDQLSGGERQRVAIARATIMHPNVVLADEPTGNLDRESGRQAIELLESLNQQGVTLIVVTHDAEIGKRASRQIRIVDGQIADDISAKAN